MDLSRLFIDSTLLTIPSTSIENSNMSKRKSTFTDDGEGLERPAKRNDRHLPTNPTTTSVQKSNTLKHKSTFADDGEHSERPTKRMRSEVSFLSLPRELRDQIYDSIFSGYTSVRPVLDVQARYFQKQDQLQQVLRRLKARREKLGSQTATRHVAKEIEEIDREIEERAKAAQGKYWKMVDAAIFRTNKQIYAESKSRLLESKHVQLTPELQIQRRPGK